MDVFRQILMEQDTKVPYSGTGSRLILLSKATLIESMFLRCFGPTVITLVLFEFNCRKFLFVQALMSLRPCGTPWYSIVGAEDSLSPWTN